MCATMQELACISGVQSFAKGHLDTAGDVDRSTSPAINRQPVLLPEPQLPLKCQTVPLKDQYSLLIPLP